MSLFLFHRIVFVVLCDFSKDQLTFYVQKPGYCTNVDPLATTLPQKITRLNVTPGIETTGWESSQEAAVISTLTDCDASQMFGHVWTYLRSHVRTGMCWMTGYFKNLYLNNCILIFNLNLIPNSQGVNNEQWANNDFITEIMSRWTSIRPWTHLNAQFLCI